MTVRAVNRVCSASFYEAYVHAPASRTWRYYPLQVLLAAIYLSARSAPFAVRWVGGELTLDQVRALLTAPVPARPVCIAAPPDPALRFEVHGAPVDGYRMALHDLHTRSRHALS